MIKTWTSKYPILKLACPQAINQIKLMSHVRGNNKNSQQVEITIFIYPKLYTLQSQYISYQHISMLLSISKPHNVFAFMWNTLTQRVRKSLKLINMQMLKENFQSVLCLPNQFNTSHKNQEVFIRLIMGLGGHDKLGEG